MCRTGCVSVCWLLFGSFCAPGSDLLLPEVNPILESGVWAAARREHVHGLEDAHEDGAVGEDVSGEYDPQIEGHGLVAG